MQTQIEKLLEDIKADYLNWTSRNGTRELSEINKKMIADFNSELGYKEGNKYIKITNKNGGRTNATVKKVNKKYVICEAHIGGTQWRVPATMLTKLEDIGVAS